MSDTRAGHVAVVFELDVEDGYPPSDSERVWAVPEAVGTYVLDNIPVFVEGFALGDEVSASLNGAGELIAGDLVSSAGHSAARVLFSDGFRDEDVRALRAELLGLGCESEFDRQHGLLAVDVPAAVVLAPVETVLNGEEAAGRSSWWLGVLRHG